MDIATHYISELEYNATPKLSKEQAADTGLIKYIYPADNGTQEFIKRPGKDVTLVEIRKAKEGVGRGAGIVDPQEKAVPAGTPKRKRSRVQEIRAKYGRETLEYRYGVEFPEGCSRDEKRNYVTALKKVIKKGIKVDTPEYWAVLKRYGWSQKKDKA